MSKNTFVRPLFVPFVEFQQIVGFEDLIATAAFEETGEIVLVVIGFRLVQNLSSDFRSLTSVLRVLVLYGLV